MKKKATVLNEDAGARIASLLLAASEKVQSGSDEDDDDHAVRDPCYCIESRMQCVERQFVHDSSSRVPAQMYYTHTSFLADICA